MNFFQHQDIARRNTRLLIALFVLAVLSLIIITLTFLTLFPWQTHAQSFSIHGSNQPLMCLLTEGCDFWVSVIAHADKLIAVAVVMVLIIGGVSLFKWFSLRQGGKVVAEMMGASELVSNRLSLHEKRLLNVVEEMALAANTPVPAVYVMRGETGINAFAAGFSPKDAVIAVTEGALYGFNREQLQGVIAHEFSHILNGDMRLNMHIIAVLHGIMFITEIGYVYLRSGRYTDRRRRSGMVFMLGLGLVIIGSVGTLFGNLIKAAVSRQREYLADASAVQFTRNPGSIADALKVIGGSVEGSLVYNAHGTEISHLFFSEALTRMQGFFATHPPLKERIKRIEPRWSGEFIKPVVYVDTEEVKEKPPIDFVPVMGVIAAVAMATSDKAEPSMALNDELHEPLGAAAAICCLLMPQNQMLINTQLLFIESKWPELHKAINNSSWKYAQRKDFLALVELSTSALRQLSVDDYVRFKQLLLGLIKADGIVDIYEWSLYYLLKSALDCHFGHAITTRLLYKTVAEIETELRIIITMLIQSTEQNTECKIRAFQRAFEICDLEFVDEKPLSVTMIEFSAAMKKITNAYPLLKSRVLKALVAAAKSDGELELIERNLIKAIGAAIETPVFHLEMPELL
jgi:Zn-dependent protease with chaperone function